jgi:hypothetical protein
MTALNDLEAYRQSRRRHCILNQALVMDFYDISISNIAAVALNESSKYRASFSKALLHLALAGGTFFWFDYLF